MLAVVPHLWIFRFRTMLERKKVATNKRVPELDSLRGIAAVGILLWHYSGHFYAQPISILFHPFYSAGRYLVDFFFVLSGLVLTRAYLRQDRRQRVARNVIERVARLYPLHLVTLLFVALGQVYLTRGIGKAPFIYEYNDVYHYVLNLLMANCTGMQRGFSFNGPAWSISVEILVNVLFFFVLAKTNRPWTCFAALMLSALAGLIVYEGRLTASGQLFGIVESRLLRASFGFFVGAILPYLVQKLDLGGFKLPKLVTDGVFGVGLMLVYSFFCSPALRATLGIDFMMVLVVFPLLVYSASNGYIVSKVLQWDPLVYLGKISYSVYLMHFPLQLLVHIVLVSNSIALDLGSPISLVGFIFVTLALSILTYNLVELPGKKFILGMAQEWIFFRC